ncbi:SURF1 family protein [Crenobacter luteus]|uniref:SURF1 family protein n=1 Tax=Crenobacter luteus TaxID=1452487 RepID=UPI001E5BDF55|nr:SURF1 family protein [Crenobacter luteus]
MWLLAVLPFLLAFWQWQRAESRAEVLARYETASHAPAGALPADPAAEPDYRRVAVAGQAVGPALWLTNAWLGREPGLRQFQAFRLADGSTLLVELGWQPQHASRRALGLPDGATGRWLPLPARLTLPGARLAYEGLTDAIDPVGLAERLGQPLRAGVVTLENPPGPLRPRPTRPPFSPDRHYAYALQWLLIGLCLVVGCAVLGRRRHESA